MATVEEVVRRLVDTGKMKVDDDDDVQTEEENPIKCGECNKRLMNAESNQKEVNIAIFQLLHTFEERIDALSLKMNENEEKVNHVKTKMMNGVQAVKTGVIYQFKKMKWAAVKSRQDVKTGLRQQRTQMNSIKRKGEVNSGAISALVTKMHILRAETKEDLNDMRATKQLQTLHCNRKVSETTEAMSTLFHSTLEERIQKEVTSMAEKHREEISELSKKMEELKENQLSLRIQLEDGLKRLEIRTGNGMSEESINIFERDISQCDLMEETSEIEIQTTSFQLENSIVVLNPQVFKLPMNNLALSNGGSECPLSLSWTIRGLTEVMELRESFEIVSEKFPFPGYPFAARAKLRWSNGGYAHFSVLFEDEDSGIVTDKNLIPSRLFFMLENQRMRMSKGRSGRMGYVKGTAFNYFLTKERNLIGKSWLTDPSYNVRDAVVVGICVEPDTADEKVQFYDEFYFEMDTYRRRNWNKKYEWDYNNIKRSKYSTMV